MIRNPNLAPAQLHQGKSIDIVLEKGLGYVQFTLKLEVWLKLKRCDGKVGNLRVQECFDVIEKLEV